MLWFRANGKLLICNVSPIQPLAESHASIVGGLVVWPLRRAGRIISGDGKKARLASHLFPVDRSRHSPYVPRNFEGSFSSPRERVAQPVEQLTFNQ